MIFIPTLPQFTLVNAFLIWLIMDGILPSNAGIPCTSPTASCVIIFTPVCMIFGKFVIIVDASLPMITGAFAATCGIAFAIPCAKPSINCNPEVINCGRLLISDSTRVRIICTATGINCGSCAPRLLTRVAMMLAPTEMSDGRFAVIAFINPKIRVAPDEISPGSAAVIPAPKLDMISGPLVCARSRIWSI